MNLLAIEKTPIASRRSAVRPHVVGIIVDAAMGHGRGILSGVLRFANTQRNWIIHEDLRAAVARPDALPRCDGIVIASDRPELVRECQNRTEFLVSCSEGGSGHGESFPVVCPDGEAVGRMAAEHLIDCQLKYFACYGDPRSAPRRFEAFHKAVSDHPATIILPTFRPKAESFHHNPSPAELVGWLKALPKPVGIFAWDDVGAREVAAACRSGIIPVPDQVAILGVNNDELLCESAWPPLSSVDVDFTQIGTMAARQLDRLLNEEKIPASDRQICVPPRAVERRQSTNLLSVDDPDVAHALTLIRENACGSFTVGDLLRAIPLARRTLERRFMEKLGRSPHEEITRVRTEMAQRLLRETDETLPRIAEKCGFSAPQALNYMFRKMVGETPAAYRRLHRVLGT